ncbi:MAG: PIN domain-containing protein [Methanobrevibacter sp.]|jgi:hypothetical protein|nr:PIN domain-containing protein [Candidatus Methanovirga procula]
MQNYYIDTDHLHSYIFLKDPNLKKVLGNIHEEQLRAENLKKIIFNRSKEIHIKVPFIVFWELFNNINKYNSTLNNINLDYLNNELFSLFKEDHVDLIPPSRECYNLADTILSKDSRFDSTDALIVSQALSDKDSVCIFSSDNTIAQSFGVGIISELNKKLCDDGERVKPLKIYE